MQLVAIGTREVTLDELPGLFGDALAGRSFGRAMVRTDKGDI
ncbi:MAG: hypothetical protein ACREPH_12835 [Rhodanobacteraceae bacterium]